MKKAGLTEIPLSHIRERMACAGQEISAGRLACRPRGVQRHRRQRDPPALDLAADPGATSRDGELLKRIMRNAGRAAAEIGASIIGGHTGYSVGLSRS